MRDDSAIMKDTLLHIRCELDGRGLVHKVLAGKAQVSLSTWFSWFPGGDSREPQIPSLACLGSLAKALPGDLFDLLLPDDFHAARCPKDVDYDDFAAGCMAFLTAKERAHREDSPGGRAIVDVECSELDVKIIPLRGRVA